MFSTIKKFFEERLSLDSGEGDEQHHRKIELASAALMYELMKTDSRVDEREELMLRQVLADTFSLDEVNVNDIVTLAEKASHDATSLYEFTALVNAHYSYEDRVLLIENLWRVAFSDFALDRYEEHLIRKVGDLIYIKHSDFIKSKLKVKESLGIGGLN